MADINDYLNQLEGPQRDAAAALIDLFNQYGLGDLAGEIVKMVQSGESQDTIAIRLQDTPEYKQRFAANDVRAKKGLGVLTPAQYIATEQAYRQVMTAAGLPVGFYDQPGDFQKFLENDVSPTEVQSRVQLAQTALYSSDQSTLDYFRQHYSDGEMTAYFLDSGKALPLIEQNFRAAQIGGAGARNGVNVDQQLADQLAQFGVTSDQASQGFSAIGTQLPTLSKLADIYHQQYGLQDIAQEVFQGDSAAAQKRKGLVNEEHAAFSGSSGTNQTSLGRNQAGQI